MDSGNSSSMQSSSGGDEEYESRAESLPAFLNPSTHFAPPPSSQPSSLLPHHHQQQPTLLDPPPSLFHGFSHQSPPNPNPNSSLLNLDVVRSSRGLRSDQNCTDDLVNNLPAGLGSSSSQSIMGVQGSSQAAVLSSMQLRSVHDNGARSYLPSDQTHGVARNPKKRTRASRRAPTTVLTTDTSNFRAMVQEFTGIPAPPFSGSPFSRRFDLFGAGSGLRSTGHLEQMGSLYPLRPSAQKVHQQSPFVSSSSSSSSSFLSNTLVDATNISSSTTNNNASISSTTGTFLNNPSSINYQLPSDHLGLPKQPQNVLNMQNQVLSFQSLMQPPPLLSSLNVPGLGAKSQPSLPLPSLEELGMSHNGQVNANLSGLANQVMTTEGMRVRNDNSWRDGPVGSNDGSQQGHHHLRTFDGNYGNLQRVNNSCKLNYSASSSSDFHHEKGLESVNVPSRGEGTVDSWICPSEFRIGD